MLGEVGLAQFDGLRGAQIGEVLKALRHHPHHLVVGEVRPVGGHQPVKPGESITATAIPSRKTRL